MLTALADVAAAAAPSSLLPFLLSLLKLFSSPGPLPGICAEVGTALPPLCGFVAQGFRVFPVEPSGASLVFPTQSCLLLFVGWGSQGMSLAQPHL